MAARLTGKVLTLLATAGVRAACAGPASSPQNRAAVRIAALQGPTAMGLVKLISDAEAGTTRHDYQVSIVGTPDEIVPSVVRHQVEIAMIPANLAAVLYQKTKGAVQAIAVNTLGALYIVESADTVHSITDLAGRSVHATGEGASPEYVFNHILRANGLEPGRDVEIRWHAEHTELATLLATGSDVVALLPQPFVAIVQAKNPAVRVSLDLNQEWDRISTGAGLVIGVAITDRQWAQANPGVLADFLADYQASTRFTNRQVAQAAELIAGHGIVADAAIAARAIPASNITCITGAQLRTKLAGYLQVLFEADPASVGGALPSDDFYHQPRGLPDRPAV